MTSIQKSENQRVGQSMASSLGFIWASMSAPLFLPLFLALCLEKAAVTKVTAPRTPLSCSTEENAAQLTGPDLTPTLGFYKVASVSACCPKWYWVHTMWILEHEKILCGLQSLCTKRTLNQRCLHFPLWIRDNLDLFWSRSSLNGGSLAGFVFWFQFYLLMLDIQIPWIKLMLCNQMPSYPDLGSKSTDDCFL